MFNLRRDQPSCLEDSYNMLVMLAREYLGRVLEKEQGQGRLLELPSSFPEAEDEATSEQRLEV